MIQAVPSFADLMLLPPTIAPTCEVFMKNDRIAVRTRDQHDQAEIIRQLEPYPHVDTTIDPEGDLILEPAVCPYRRLMLVWPGGRIHGALLWEGGFYASVDASAFQALFTLGLHIQTIFCSPDDTLEMVLLKLSRSPV
jgi:hypothetical protein